MSDEGIAFVLSGGPGVQTLVVVMTIYGEGQAFDCNKAYRLRSLRTFVLGDKIIVDEGIAFGPSGGRGVQTLVDTMTICGEGQTFDHNRDDLLLYLRTFVLGDEIIVDEGIAFRTSGR